MRSQARLPGPPWAAGPEQAALAAELDPVCSGRGADLSPRSPGQKGELLPAPSSAEDPLSSRVEEGQSRAGARHGHPHTPVSRGALSPAGTRGFPPPQAEDAPPPAPLKRLRFPSPHLGSPSPSLSQTRGTSASAEGPGDGPRIFNF